MRRVKSKRVVRAINHALACSMAQSDYYVPGQSQAVAEALCKAGYNISAIFSIDWSEIVHEVEDRTVHDWIRKQTDTINGVKQRALRWDGKGWMHIKGRWYRANLHKGAPEQELAMQEFLEDLKHCIKALRPGQRGYKTSIRQLSDLWDCVSAGGSLEFAEDDEATG